MISKIQEKVKEAMKAGNKTRLAALRMLLADAKNEQINTGKELDEAGLVQIVKRSIKKRKDSIEQFRNASRMDLVEKEEAQLKVLEEFAPKQLSQEETTKIIDQVIAETGVSSKQEMGKVMKAVMAKVGSQVDGKMVQQWVSNKLK